MACVSEKLCALSQLPGEILRALLLPEPLPVAEPEPPADGGLLAEIDWEALRQDANRQAVGVLVLQRLQELGWGRFVAPQTLARWRADARHAELQYRLQRADAVQISDALGAARRPPRLRQGRGYREQFYRPAGRGCAAMRTCWSTRPISELVRALMHDLGFQHAACTLDYRDFRLAGSTRSSRPRPSI